MSRLTVYDIVKVWLIEHGYDGLYSDSGCGCYFTDMFACQSDEWNHPDCSNCMPGRKQPCPDDPDETCVGPPNTDKR